MRCSWRAAHRALDVPPTSDIVGIGRLRHQSCLLASTAPQGSLRHMRTSAKCTSAVVACDRKVCGCRYQSTSARARRESQGYDAVHLAKRAAQAAVARQTTPKHTSKSPNRFSAPENPRELQSEEWVQATLARFFSNPTNVSDGDLKTLCASMDIHHADTVQRIINLTDAMEKHGLLSDAMAVSLLMCIYRAMAENRRMRPQLFPVATKINNHVLYKNHMKTEVPLAKFVRVLGVIGKADAAIQSVQQLLSLGIFPSIFYFNDVMKACIDAHRVDKMVEVYEALDEFDAVPHITTRKILLYGLHKALEMQAAGQHAGIRITSSATDDTVPAPHRVEELPQIDIDKCLRLLLEAHDDKGHSVARAELMMLALRFLIEYASFDAEGVRFLAMWSRDVKFSRLRALLKEEEIARIMDGGESNFRFCSDLLTLAAVRMREARRTAAESPTEHKSADYKVDLISGPMRKEQLMLIAREQAAQGDDSLLRSLRRSVSADVAMSAAVDALNEATRNSQTLSDSINPVAFADAEHRHGADEADGDTLTHETTRSVARSSPAVRSGLSDGRVERVVNERATAILREIRKRMAIHASAGGMTQASSLIQLAEGVISVMQAQGVDVMPESVAAYIAAVIESGFPHKIRVIIPHLANNPSLASAQQILYTLEDCIREETASTVLRILPDLLAVGVRPNSSVMDALSEAATKRWLAVHVGSCPSCGVTSASGRRGGAGEGVNQDRKNSLSQISESDTLSLGRSKLTADQRRNRLLTLLSSETRRKPLVHCVSATAQSVLHLGSDFAVYPSQQLQIMQSLGVISLLQDSTFTRLALAAASRPCGMEAWEVWSTMRRLGVRAAHHPTLLKEMLKTFATSGLQLGAWEVYSLLYPKARGALPSLPKIQMELLSQVGGPEAPIPLQITPPASPAPPTTVTMVEHATVETHQEDPPVEQAAVTPAAVENHADADGPVSLADINSSSEITEKILGYKLQQQHTSFPPPVLRQLFDLFPTAAEGKQTLSDAKLAVTSITDEHRSKYQWFCMNVPCITVSGTRDTAGLLQLSMLQHVHLQFMQAVMRSLQSITGSSGNAPSLQIPPGTALDVVAICGGRVPTARKLLRNVCEPSTSYAIAFPAVGAAAPEAPQEVLSIHLCLGLLPHHYGAGIEAVLRINEALQHAVLQHAFAGSLTFTYGSSTTVAPFWFTKPSVGFVNRLETVLVRRYTARGALTPLLRKLPTETSAISTPAAPAAPSFIHVKMTDTLRLFVWSEGVATIRCASDVAEKANISMDKLIAESQPKLRSDQPCYLVAVESPDKTAFTVYMAAAARLKAVQTTEILQMLRSAAQTHCASNTPVNHTGSLLDLVEMPPLISDPSPANYTKEQAAHIVSHKALTAVQPLKAVEGLPVASLSLPASFAAIVRHPESQTLLNTHLRGLLQLDNKLQYLSNEWSVTASPAMKYLVPHGIQPVSITTEPASGPTHPSLHAPSLEAATIHLKTVINASVDEKLFSKIATINEQMSKATSQQLLAYPRLYFTVKALLDGEETIHVPATLQKPSGELLKWWCETHGKQPKLALQWQKIATIVSPQKATLPMTADSVSKALLECFKPLLGDVLLDKLQCISSVAISTLNAPTSATLPTWRLASRTERQRVTAHLQGQPVQAVASLRMCVSQPDECVAVRDLLNRKASVIFAETAANNTSIPLMLQRIGMPTSK